MAKTNGDPMGVSNAAKGNKFQGQLAGGNGPVNLEHNPVHDEVLDKDYYGTKVGAPEKRTTKF